MYIINPTSGKEIPNSYPTSSSTGSNSSTSSGASQSSQELFSKILTKCATMTDEVAAAAASSAAASNTNTTTVNGTATILLSPSPAHHHHHHQHSHRPTQHPVGVSPQSSPASSSSSASSPIADGPQQQPAGRANKSAGTNGTSGKHSAGGKLNGNGPASSPVTATTASGGRLQFFKDGKFILELARARDGEKHSWISVPRKTFWPPTVSSTSANFHKHESSTSLSFSDDNSSIQSSPWQRDHCWKQTNPRPHISREMSLYYHRPSCVRFKFSREVLKRLRLKRRRPYEQSAGNVAPHYEIIRVRREDEEKSPRAESASGEDDAMDLKLNGKSPDDEHLQGSGSADEEDAKPKATNGGTTKDFKIRKPVRRQKDLAAIVQRLTVRVANAVNNGTATTTPRVPPTVRSVFSSQSHQHVSPRKRILRELEKVSLEDSSSTMKRSRPKPPGSNSTVITATTATPLAPVNSNGTTTGSSSSNGHSSSSSSSNSNGKLTNGAASATTAATPEARVPSSIPTTPVSRPISSYSITSLLGHNSSSESRPKQEATNSSTSHHPYQQHPPSTAAHHHYPYLGKDVITSPKSPSDAAHLSQRYYGKKRSPSSPEYGSGGGGGGGAGYGMIRSPDLSPSPEHQGHSSGFTRYRQHPYSIHPTVSSPSSYSTTVSRCSPSPSTNDSAYSASNAKYRASYLASSGSPPSSSNPVSANSPQHYSRQSPLNFARSPPPSHHHHQSSYPLSSKSPRASPSVEPIRVVPATTPTSSTPTTPGIRTVPKKTAALRQQFGSPSSSPSTSATGGLDPAKRERSNSNSSSASLKKELDYAEQRLSSAADVVDGLPSSTSSPVIRPSTVIASPTPHHPAAVAAAAAHPFYMYPPQIAASLLAAQQQQHHQSSAVPFLPASPIASYYQHMYNQAAVVAAYRNPLWMHYPGLSPHAAVAAAAAAAAISPPSGVPPPSVAPVAPPQTHSSSHRDSGSRTHSAPYQHQPTPHPQHHHAAQHNWNVPGHERPTARTPPAAVTTSVAKDDQDLAADVPLNLSKH